MAFHENATIATVLRLLQIQCYDCNSYSATKGVFKFLRFVLVKNVLI